MAKAKKGAAKGKKSKAAEEPPTPTKLVLEHLPNEILDIIFAEAAKGYSYAQKLQLCLISKRLRPRGEHSLYEDLDFANAEKRTRLRVADSKTWAKSKERDVSASRSVSFLENLLPKLKPTQIQSTKHISLELSFAGCPVLWAVRELRMLFRVFRLSKAHLHLLVSPIFVNTDFITLLAVEETTAFAAVNVEIVTAADGNVAAVVQESLSDVVLFETDIRQSASAFPKCDIWTQYDDDRRGKLPLVVPASRGIYLVAPTVTGFSLFRDLSQVARPRITGVDIWPLPDTGCSLAPLEEFRDKERVFLNLEHASRDSAQTVTLLRSLVLPSVTTLVVNFSEPRPPLAELFLLYHQAEWAASIRTFGWTYEAPNGTDAAVSPDDLALIDASGSWLKDFSRLMEEREATLQLWDGKQYVEVAPRPCRAEE